MPANLLTCADCTTQYALDLTACPHCGSSNFATKEGVVTKRLPLFVTVRCACGRGPWTVRLEAKHSGLLELPTLACASCGSRVPVTWPPEEEEEEEPMSPKITAHGGATNARAADVSPAADASQPLVEAEVGQGRPSLPEPSSEPFQGEELPELDEVQDEEASDEVTESGGDRYDEMTIADLRSEVASRNLPTRGTRQQIIARLREADTA